MKTEFLVDKNRDYAQVLEERVNNGLVAGYVYGNDLISQQRGSEKSFYLVDGLGSTRGLTNASGVVTDRYSYDAFGNLIESGGNSENNYLFAGEQFDKNLGDYYLRQRYYDTDTGRFTRRDSYEGRLREPLTLHKYLYTHANPINNIDPTGLYKLEIRYRGFHSDIFITDRDSSRAYWASAENQDSSDYASGIFDNISSNSSNSSSTGFGILVEHHTNSLRRPGFFETGSRQVLLDTNSSTDQFPKAIENKIQATLFRIEASRIRYNFLYRNSNSAAFQALEEALGYRPKPNIFVPGWSTNPFTGKDTLSQPKPVLQPFTQPFWVNPTSMYPLFWLF